MADITDKKLLTEHIAATNFYVMPNSFQSVNVLH